MAYRSPRGDVRSVWIGDVRPELDGGRFPVKREVGDTFEVTADILQEGHGGLAAVLRYRTVKDTAWHEARMEPLGNDRWAGRFLLEENTRYVYTLEAWPDAYRTWADDLRKRLGAGMDVTGELLEGAALLRDALARVVGADRRRLEARLADFEATQRRRPAGASPPQRGGHGGPRQLSGPSRGDAVRPGARGGRGPATGPVRRMVRAVPAVPEPGAGPTRHVPRLHRAAAGDRGHGLRRALPAADPSDRAELPEGAQQRARGGSRRPGLPVGHRQRARRAQGDRSRPGHARRTSGRSSAPLGTTGSRSRWTTPSSARRTIPG